MRLSTFRSILFFTAFLGIGLSASCQGMDQDEQRCCSWFLGSCIGLTTLALPKEYAVPVLVSAILAKIGIASSLNSYAREPYELSNIGAFTEALLRASIIGSGTLLFDQHIRDKRTPTLVQEVSLS